MKREHIYVTALAILLCFAYWVMFSGCNRYYIVLPETESICDSSELIKVREELKEVKRLAYWKQRKIDSLKLESHRKDGLIGDSNVFVRMYFDHAGKLIEAK